MSDMEKILVRFREVEDRLDWLQENNEQAWGNTRIIDAERQKTEAAIVSLDERISLLEAQMEVLIVLVSTSVVNRMNPVAREIAGPAFDNAYVGKAIARLREHTDRITIDFLSDEKG